MMTKEIAQNRRQNTKMRRRMQEKGENREKKRIKNSSTRAEREHKKMFFFPYLNSMCPQLQTRAATQHSPDNLMAYARATEWELMGILAVEKINAELPLPCLLWNCSRHTIAWQKTDAIAVLTPTLFPLPLCLFSDPLRNWFVHGTCATVHWLKPSARPLYLLMHECSVWTMPRAVWHR